LKIDRIVFAQVKVHCTKLVCAPAVLVIGAAAAAPAHPAVRQEAAIYHD
jgi:hypothetical protein